MKLEKNMEKTSEIKINDVVIFINKNNVYIDTPDHYNVLINGEKHVNTTYEKESGKGILKLIKGNGWV